MKYTEREKWIQAEGAWMGLGFYAIALGLTIWIFPSEIGKSDPISPIIIGIVFLVFGFVARKQIKKII